MGRPVIKTPEPYVIDLGNDENFESDTDKAFEMKGWLKEQCKGYAAFDSSMMRVCFEDKRDAALFKVFFL